MNDVLHSSWGDWLFWSVFWQVTLAWACAAAAAHWLWSRPAWNSWLWRIVLCKGAIVLLVPFSFAIPLWALIPSPPAVVSPAEMAKPRPIATAAIAAEDRDPAPAVLPPQSVIQPSRAPLSWTVILIAAWLLGIAVIAGVWCRQWFALRRLLYEAQPLDDAAILAMQRDLGRQLNVRERIALRVTERAISPLLIGWLRPRILIPQWMVAADNREELRTALAHELAHVRRRDVVWNLFAAGVGMVYFFHPLAWLALRRLRLAQESAADELALRITGIAPVAYAQTLLRVAESARATPRTHPLLLTASRSYRDLSTRIRSMQAARPTPRRATILHVAAAGLLLLGLLPWHPAAQRATTAAAADDVQKAEEPTFVKLSDERLKEMDEALSRLKAAKLFIQNPVPPGDSRYWININTTKETTDFQMSDIEILGRGVMLMLSLEDVEVTPGGLKQLKTAKSIRSLTLSDESINDEVLAVLPTLPLNDQLTLGNGTYTIDGMKHVGACKKLTSISLKGTTITDDFVEPLLELPELTSLDLQSPNFTEKAKAFQLRLPGLTSLSTRMDRSSQLVLKPEDVARMTKLKNITLHGDKYGDDMARALADHCPELETVQFLQSSISNDGVRELSRLKKLKYLIVERSQLDDGVADAIGRMKQLERLNLNYSSIGDETIAAASTCLSINELSVNKTKVTDAGIQHVLKWKDLRALHLADNKRITDESLDVLMRLPSVDKSSLFLQLQFTSISEDGIRDLKDALPQAQIISSYPEN